MLGEPCRERAGHRDVLKHPLERGSVLVPGNVLQLRDHGRLSVVGHAGSGDQAPGEKPPAELLKDVLVLDVLENRNLKGSKKREHK